jgi:hypothetical protein
MLLPLVWSVSLPVRLLALCGGAMLAALRTRMERKVEGRWRVQRHGRGGVSYKEWHGGAWRTLDIDGEVLSGKPSFVVYFGSVAAWRDTPEWARGRRKEIIGRIKSVMRIPEYEYTGEEVMSDDDWEALTSAAGGLSLERCSWRDCERLALKSKRVCVRHAHLQLS